jgi:acetolactate synthase-1/2/3 large subunit
VAGASVAHDSASRATSAEDFAKQLERALAEPGPALIEAMVPSIV